VQDLHWVCKFLEWLDWITTNVPPGVIDADNEYAADSEDVIFSKEAVESGSMIHYTVDVWDTFVLVEVDKCQTLRENLAKNGVLPDASALRLEELCQNMANKMG
jgi:hypothetical protein